MISAEEIEVAAVLNTRLKGGSQKAMTVIVNMIRYLLSKTTAF
jgi:hypothetical protein